MSRPLYADVDAPTTMPPGANAGLWFDKFCDQWDTSRRGSGGLTKPSKTEQGGVRNWLATITANLSDSERRAGPAHVGDGLLIAEIVARLRTLATAARGFTVELHSTSRIAAGTGNPNPLENGLQWHRGLGVPYLPGSSLKGLTRAWADIAAKVDPSSPVAGGDVTRMFGPRNVSKSPQAGTVIFLDALPCAPVRLEADVLTPHYRPYYEGVGENCPPADWYLPSPVLFATVAENQPFLFTILPRGGRDTGGVDDVALAITLLKDALLNLGIGAKTAVGYGRFAGSATRDAATASAITSTAQQRYKAGDVVRATRVDDPGGKGRPWFTADDGFGGRFIGEVAPDVQIAQSGNLEIAGVNSRPPGYNFMKPRGPKPSPTPSGRRK